MSTIYFVNKCQHSLIAARQYGSENLLTGYFNPKWFNIILIVTNPTCVASLSTTKELIQIEQVFHLMFELFCPSLLYVHLFLESKCSSCEPVLSS